MKLFLSSSIHKSDQSFWKRRANIFGFVKRNSLTGPLLPSTTSVTGKVTLIDITTIDIENFLLDYPLL